MRDVGLIVEGFPSGKKEPSKMDALFFTEL